MRASRFLRLLTAGLLTLGFESFVSAKDLYVAQTTAGTGDGSSAANALPVTWFNASTSWGTGAGQIGPGDTVHLCGVISSELEAWHGGTAGHVITFFFEPNAKLSQPAGTLMDISNCSYVVIDGGSNGIMENTDNGTTLGHQIDASGINAPQSGNLEVKNLTIQNIYVHTSVADDYSAHKTGSGIFMNGFGNNMSIHDCVFHDVDWALTMACSDGVTGIDICRNSFYNCDHGVAGIGGTMSSPANVNIHDNHFGSTANWDTSDGTFHHDGIHIFFAPGGLLSGVNIYNNLFDGDWGTNNTAHIFIQGDYSYANLNAVSNVAIYNNVFVQYPGNRLNNGMLSGYGPNWRIQNNTFRGSGVTNAVGLYVAGPSLSITNNLFSSLTTYINIQSSTTFAVGGLNHNLYADNTPGGNPSWSMLGSACQTFAAWQALTGQEAQSLMVSQAYLNSNNTLQSNSPAVGAGANLSAFFTTDISGHTRSVPWDIGAHKFLMPKPPAPKNLRIVPQ